MRGEAADGWVSAGAGGGIRKCPPAVQATKHGATAGGMAGGGGQGTRHTVLPGLGCSQCVVFSTVSRLASPQFPLH